jgi:hypothetical protein
MVIIVIIPLKFLAYKSSALRIKIFLSTAIQGLIVGRDAEMMSRKSWSIKA